MVNNKKVVKDYKPGGVHYEGLIFKKEGSIAILTLNLPDKLNPINPRLSQEVLPRIIEEVRQDDDIRVLIITGAGTGFCSGVDLRSMENIDLARKEIAERSRRSFLAPPGLFTLVLRRLEKPTIAAINGVAAGAGLSLAMACDIRIASEHARFGSLFIKRGLVPDSGLTYYLPQAIGTSKALELMLTGDIIDAKEAERIGLVSRVVPHEDLMQVTGELARKIATGSPIAIELTKCAVYKGSVDRLESQFDFEDHALRICSDTEEFKEGVSSFFDKKERNNA